MVNEVNNNKLSIAVLLNTTKHLCFVYENEIASKIANLCDKNIKTIVISTIYQKMSFLLFSLSRLDCTHDYQTVIGLSRTFFEHFVDITCISKDKSGLEAEKYFYFPTVATYKAATKYHGFKGEFSDKYDYFTGPSFSDGAKYYKEKNEKMVFDLIDKYWKKKEGKHKKKNTIEIPEYWHGSNTREHAKKIGLEDMYLQIYPVTSWYIHSGPTGTPALSEGFIDAMFFFGHSIVHYIFRESTNIVAVSLSLQDFDLTLEKLKINVIEQEEYSKLLINNP